MIDIMDQVVDQPILNQELAQVESIEIEQVNLNYSSNFFSYSTKLN